jgi:hypothetical protein
MIAESAGFSLALARTGRAAPEQKAPFSPRSTSAATPGLFWTSEIASRKSPADSPVRALRVAASSRVMTATVPSTFSDTLISRLLRDF